ncbi:hypothetical protein ACIOJF_02490 [Glutamicibacter sp. NPDC087831]|uniref:hypothetical protein n=1 Tax=Glutamicibacter sp. NPDC087831 TaxID=3363998 RepID=UPI00381315B0
MATFTPQRLKRTLSPITGDQWQFAFSAASFVEYDDTITSISINRGVSDRNVGHNPNTCEVTFTGRRDNFLTGNLMRLSLRESVAQRLATHIGADPEKIIRRFTGRLATIDIEDLGGDKFYTSVAGSSHLTQMNYSVASFTPNAGQNLGSILADATKANEPIRGVDFSTNLGAVNIHQFAAGEQMLFKDGLGKYATDIGITLQEYRDGSTKALGIPWRIDTAASRVVTEYPLMRNQAIAPGNYSQHSERPAVRVEYTIKNESGGTATRVAEVANPTGELRETVSIDWSYLQVEDVQNQLVREAYARVFGSSSRLYTLPTVKIDMLLLLKDGSPYSKKIAKQILEMEVSESVSLSGDWPKSLQGVHFAEGIKEIITPDSWEFELSLVPHAVATGNVSPTVQPRAWDSATKVWNDETREWNQA